MVRSGVVDSVQSVRTRIVSVYKMTKKNNATPIECVKNFFPICDPDDSFVICFFDLDRLPFQFQPVPTQHGCRRHPRNKI